MLEFVGSHNMDNVSAQDYDNVASLMALPATFDSRNRVGKNGTYLNPRTVVSDVRDQGECGSCAAYAATDNAEAAWRIAGGSNH